MADSKISALPAVVTPVGTDEFAVNQGGVSKKITATQILDGTVPYAGNITQSQVSDIATVTQVDAEAGTATDDKLWTAQRVSQAIAALGGGGGDVTKVGTPVNNQIGVWTGDGTIEGDANFTYDGTDVQLTGGDLQILGTSRPYLRDVEASETIPNILPIGTNTNTGFSGVAGADEIHVVAGGVRVMRWRESTGTPITRIYGDIESDNASGPGMINETSSATNPTLVPAQSDQDTGIGRNAADQLSLIAGGIEIARCTEAAVEQFIVSPGALLGSAALPSLAWGDGDTGLSELADDILAVSVAGVQTFAYTATTIESLSSSGAKLLQTGVSGTIPTLIPRGGDPDSGIGSSANDSLALIADGVQAMLLSEAAAVVTVEVGGSLQFANSSGPVLTNGVGTATVATIAPSRADPNTGFSAPGGDTLNIIAGSQTAAIFVESGGVVTATIGQSTAATHTFMGDWAASTGAGPVMLDVSASSSVPTLIPNQADADTGIGRDAVDGLALIAGGLDCLRVREIGSARAVGLYTTTPIIQQTGVAVTAAGIHAALVNLGAFTA